MFGLAAYPAPSDTVMSPREAPAGGSFAERVAAEADLGSDRGRLIEDLLTHPLVGDVLGTNRRLPDSFARLLVTRASAVSDRMISYYLYRHRVDDETRSRFAAAALGPAATRALLATQPGLSAEQIRHLVESYADNCEVTNGVVWAVTDLEREEALALIEQAGLSVAIAALARTPARFEERAVAWMARASDEIIVRHEGGTDERELQRWFNEAVRGDTGGRVAVIDAVVDVVAGHLAEGTRTGYGRGLVVERAVDLACVISARLSADQQRRLWRIPARRRVHLGWTTRYGRAFERYISFCDLDDSVAAQLSRRVRRRYRRVQSHSLRLGGPAVHHTPPGNPIDFDHDRCGTHGNGHSGTRASGFTPSLGEPGGRTGVGPWCGFRQCQPGLDAVAESSLAFAVAHLPVVEWLEGQFITEDEWRMALSLAGDWDATVADLAAVASALALSPA